MTLFRLTSLAALSICSISSAQTLSISELNQSLAPGVNLGNTFEVARNETWESSLKPEPRVIERIHDAGFASIRFPIRWSDYAADEPPYKIEPAFMEKVDALVDLAIQLDMKAIINIHHFNEFYDDPKGRLPEFLAIWEQLAEHYKDYPRDSLFLEILNEPHAEMTHEHWQAIFPPALMIIRQSNPDRPVLIGGANWGGWESIVQMDMPKDDNIIATFHYYLPFDFTHQGASWVDPVRPLGPTFSASVDEVSLIASHFAQVKAWADEHNLPVNVGEFGAYSTADMESRVTYTRTIRQMAEAFDFSWHYWEFGAGFGIWNPRTDQFRTPLKNALLE